MGEDVIRHPDDIFTVEMQHGPALVTAYSLVTDHSGDQNLDPISWVFEGSYNNVDWEELDVVDGYDEFPTARNAATEKFGELFHLNDSHTCSVLLGSRKLLPWLVLS